MNVLPGRWKRLAQLAFFLLVPASISNAYFQYRNHCIALASEQHVNDIQAMVAEAEAARAQLTVKGTFYGSQEALDSLPSIDADGNYGFLDIIHDLGGKKYQLQIHQCPVGADYTGDLVYSGFLAVWDDDQGRNEMIADIRSLGAREAAGYTMYKSQTACVANALATIPASRDDGSLAVDAKSFRALLEACVTKADEASTLALLQNVLLSLPVQAP